jgi:hypothetical protein
MINVTLSGKALQSADTTSAGSYFRKGDLQLSIRKFDSSRLNFEKALKHFRNAKNWSRSIVCYNKMAEVFFGVSAMIRQSFQQERP